MPPLSLYLPQYQLVVLVPHKYGEFSLYAYEDSINGDVHIALVKGNLNPDDEVMVRVQQNNTLHLCVIHLEYLVFHL